MRKIFFLCALLVLASCLRETARGGTDLSLNKPEADYNFAIRDSDDSYLYDNTRYTSVVFRGSKFKTEKPFSEEISYTKQAMLEAAKERAANICKSGYREVNTSYSYSRDCNTNEPIFSTLCLIHNTAEKIVLPAIPEWLDYYYKCN